MKSMTIAAISAALLFAAAGSGHAQDKPEPVQSFAQIQRSPEWYATQLKLWRAEVDRNSTNPDAWLNYYKAARYVGFSDTSDQKVKQERMAKLIGEMGKAIPNTFEYHYIKWWDGGNDESMFAELQKAYELRQDYTLISDDFITYYEMHGDEEKMRFFCRKWYETKDISPALLNYSYNVLMSLEKNAIFVTEGDNDTYPVWVLQYARNIRPDVTVMNISLMAEPSYRAMMLKRHGIGCDYAKLAADSAATISYEEWVGRFLKNIAENNTKRPVYFGLTVEPSLVDSIKKDLYTVGLANRYSPKRIDNIALLQKNWENFHLDYLDQGFYDEMYTIADGNMPRLNMNYVPPMMILYEHYLMSGEAGKAEKFKNMALSIGRDGEQEKEVREYIDGIASQGGEELNDVPEHTTAEAESEKSTLARDVSIFPNPAYSMLTLKLPDAIESDIQLVDLQGHVLRTLKGSGREVRIDIDGISAGTYLVNIRTASGNASKKVQIVR